MDPSSQAAGTWLTRNMTNNQNHIKSVTDAGENTVQYFWNHDKDLMLYLLDGRGNRISYDYDEADRLLGVSQQVTADGQTEMVENTYTYTDDRLTVIGHNGFSYGFVYDGFGNAKNASVAGNQVVSYEYEEDNGNLKIVIYGNGDYIPSAYRTHSGIEGTTMTMRQGWMYYLRRRYYDPGVRRFLCYDEMSTVKASMETMHNRNLYAYCNQNPVVREDREGTI